MKIHEVEKLVGITKKNIRFYEHEGLLSPGRSDNGYRNYSQEDVEALKKIKLLRSLSFPLEEIRQMQNGVMTMEDGARRHMTLLNRQQDSIEKSRRLCQELEEHRETLQSLNADLYLDKLRQMEKEGAVFMNIKKQDRSKQYIAPAIAAGLMVIFMAACILLLFTVAITEKMHMGEIIFLTLIAAMFLAVIVGVLIALRQRIKQIQGGEEDVAAKY